MSDQAESLRRLVFQMTPEGDVPRRGMLLLVLGVDPAGAAHRLGLHLALAWQRRHDAASLVHIGCQPPSWFKTRGSPTRATLREVIDQQRTLREAWLTGPCGLPLIAGDLGENPSLSSRLLMDQLRAAARKQRVIVNTERLDDLRVLLPAADHCLFVTTAEPERLTATYQAVKAVSADLGGARCWLAMTQANDQAAALELQNRIITACDRCLNLALSPLGKLLDDPLLDADIAERTVPVGSAGSERLQRELDRMLERLDTAHQSPSPPRAPTRVGGMRHL
jgi:flagellar biosynthesis protein FlhG